KCFARMIVSIDDRFFRSLTFKGDVTFECRDNNLLVVGSRFDEDDYAAFGMITHLIYRLLNATAVATTVFSYRKLVTVVDCLGCRLRHASADTADKKKKNVYIFHSY